MPGRNAQLAGNESSGQLFYNLVVGQPGRAAAGLIVGQNLSQSRHAGSVEQKIMQKPQGIKQVAKLPFHLRIRIFPPVPDFKGVGSF